MHSGAGCTMVELFYPQNISYDVIKNVQSALTINSVTHKHMTTLNASTHFCVQAFASNIRQLPIEMCLLDIPDACALNNVNTLIVVILLCICSVIHINCNLEYCTSRHCILFFLKIMNAFTS